MSLTPHPQPLPLARGGETKRSFGSLGFLFSDIYKREYSAILKVESSLIESACYYYENFKISPANPITTKHACYGS
ncbi:hypothetical protein NSTC745_02751 [Nostoc sp. DSM 114161]|jgi:hypothetical protein